MKHVVVFTGAGVSAESGLKTFRDSDGLWNNYNIYEVATPEAFDANPALVLEFYNMRRRDVAKAKPNAAHVGIAELEKQFNVSVITQNIDDLHERAGSTNVLHLHGEIFKMRSTADTSEIYPIDSDIKVGDVTASGHQLRPHIVWFGEAVPMMDTAASIMQTADIFILVGSSLQVYPAAGLIDFVPPEVTKFIIDKSAPTVNRYKNVRIIEKPATEGIAEVLELLKRPEFL
jgi:NAD-dependent deacetylase